MHLEHFKRLYAYDRWANARLLDAVAGLSDEQFTKNLGSSFSSVRDTLVHIVSAEWIWLQRWKGNSLRRHFDAANFPAHGAVRSWLTEVENEQIKFLDALTQEQLTASLSYLNFEGVTYSHPLWEQMTHLVNHSTYHRGQVTTLLRQLGSQAVSLDLIFYIREHPSS